MADTEYHDYRNKTCGAVPELVDILAKCDSEVVEFHIRSHIVPQTISALATGDKWSLEVIDELDSARLKFTRKNISASDRLNLI